MRPGMRLGKILRFSLRQSCTIASPSEPSVIRIWNAFHKPKPEKQILKTKHPKLVSWYACGPTVYDSAHIGHASSYIRLDVIRRILERQNIRVLQVMGITDIDDKIITKSQELGIPWDHISRKYEAEFVSDLKSLNIKLPHVRARVSDFIPNIIRFVDGLISSGFAYTTSDGSVNFDTRAYGNYGKFRQTQDDEPSPEPGAEKRSVKDFAVWKGWKPGEPFWTAPWGKGRPGWHIECSVMASHFFGESLDIHTGGMDLVFPHHENEEAQCCAKFGRDRWVSHWIHTGHLNLKDDVKMSKSLGNTLTIQQFLKDSSPDILRMLCILSPYQKVIEYSSIAHNSATTKLQRLYTFISDCQAILTGNKIATFHPESEILFRDKLSKARFDVDFALTDNFDTESAVEMLFNLISDFYRLIEPVGSIKIKGSTDFGLVLESQALLQDFLDLVGMVHGTSTSTNVASNEMEEVVNTILTDFVQFRRSVRTYALALNETQKDIRKKQAEERKELVAACDDIRNRLAVFGIELKDHGENSSFSYKRK